MRKQKITRAPKRPPPKKATKPRPKARPKAQAVTIPVKDTMIELSDLRAALAKSRAQVDTMIELHDAVEKERDALRARNAELDLAFIEHHVGKTRDERALWRALAEDAIKAMGELVEDISGRDLIEDGTFSGEIAQQVIGLQHRARELSGQQGLFT